MKHPWSSQQFAEGARGSGRSEEVIVAAEEIAQKIKRTHPELPVILTLQHLAVLTDVSSEILSKIIDRYEDPYRIFRVKKRGSGAKGSAPVRKYRIICVPNPALMRVQRWIAQQILNVIEPHPASFAFAPDRGMVGAVERHAGSRWLIKIDVRNFFESIKESSVYRIFKDLGYTELLSFELSRICTRMHNGQKPFEPEQLFSGESRRPYRLAPQGHLPQGAPTSPMLANLAVRKLDTQLERLACLENWTYTRYADDLAFSTTSKATKSDAMRIIALTKRALKASNLQENPHKTSVAPPGARKIVLGVLVDRETPKLTRSFRNNLETHLYALNSPKIGPAAHRRARRFASVIGMRRHIQGLLAFAHQIDPIYAKKMYAAFNVINWES